MNALPAPMLALVALPVLLLLLWRPFLSVVLFAIATPLGLTALPGGLDVITLLSALVVACALWDRLLRAPSLIPVSWAAIAASVWTIGIVGSVAFSADIGRAAILGTWQILAAWLAVGISVLIRTEAQLRLVLVATLLGAGIVAMGGLSGGFNQTAAFSASVVDDRAMGIFSQPNEYGLYCSMIWGLSLGVACLGSGYLRWLAALCSVLSLAGLAASFSRGSWLGAIAAAIVMAILVPQTRRPQAIVISAVVGVLSASLVILPYWQLPGLLLSRFLSIFSGEANPYDNRPLLLAEGLRQWGENLVFGLGPNMYPVESLTLQSGTRTLEGQHAHNLVITMGAEQGLIGIIALGIFTAAAVSAIRAARTFTRHTSRRNPQHIPLGAAVVLSAMGSLTALIAAGVVDYPLRNPLTRATCWMIIGLLLAGQRCLPARNHSAIRAHSEAGEQVSTP